MPHCQKCKFGGELQNGESKFVPGRGNKNADIMVISDYPDKLASYLHEPFKDEAAAAIDWMLFNNGLIERSVTQHKTLNRVKPNNNRYKKIYYTTALKCFPCSGSGKPLKSMNIDSEVRNKCRKYHLAQEIKSVKPKFILTIGNEALKMVRGDHGSSAVKDRGFWEWNEEFQAHVLPTATHFAITSSWEVTSGLMHDIEAFANGVKNGVPEYKLGDNYGLLTDLKKIRKFFKFLKKRKRVTFDFETTSLRHWDMNEEPLGLAFCWKKGSARYIPFLWPSEEDPETKLPIRNRVFSPEEYDEVKGLIKDFFENTPHIKKDGQNMKFDIHWLYHMGIRGHGFDWDTMQFHHLIDENTPNNLTYLTTYYRLNFPHYDQEIKPYIKYKGRDKDKNREKAYEYIPTEILAKYGCADVDATFRIRAIQRARAEQWQLNLYYNVSVPLSIVTRHIERHGVKINLDEISDLELEYQKKIDKKKAQFCKYVNIKDFNVNSNPQMQKLLFENLKLFTPFKTKSGKPSTDAKSFEWMEKKQGNKSLPVGDGKKVVVKTVFKRIIELRTMGKMKSTYLTGMRLIADENGRIHTSYMTAGTVTSRSASRGPNLQNIPNDPIFRSLFIAGPDRFLIPADYSQIEARILPYVAREDSFCLKFAEEGFDVHTYNSALYRDKPFAEVTKEERKQDKGITFGVNYGRSYKSIADEYGMTVESVKNKVETYYQKNPNIAKYNKNKELESKNKHPRCKGRTDYYVENAFRRRRHFSLYYWIDQPEIKAVRWLRESVGEDEVEKNYRLLLLRSGAERQAVNFPIQSFAAEVLTMASYRVYKRMKREFLDAYLVLTVHDMLCMDVNKGQQKEGMKVMLEEMPIIKRYKNKAGKTIRLAFPVDAELTKHWVQ
jgi:DNA polymerase-1